MKALPLAVSVLVAAVPILASAADEKPKNKSNESTISSTAPAGADSPLVRAAKASGRLGKKPVNVITNATLAKSGGHVTTTKYITQLPPLPEETDNKDDAAAKALAAKKQKLEAEQKAKDEEAAKKTKVAARAAADYYGEDAETRVDDPAAQEQALQQSTSTSAPQQDQGQKPPR